MATTSKKVPRKRSIPKTLWTPPAGPWDDLNKVQTLEIVDAILKVYFGVEDWLSARNKKFPGLA